MWSNYAIITDLNSQLEEFKTALLLHSLGPDAIRVYNRMKFEPAEQQITKAILNRFDAKFLGETRELFERFKFNKRDQEPGEMIESYLAILNNLAKTCSFSEHMKDKLLVDCDELRHL